jgi:D-amino-acid dehydrogenase
VANVFPQLAAAGDPELWAGLRPATPGNVPVVGRVRFRNLYLNTGHGTLGWTMACGSGKLLADLVKGRAPEIDPAPYLLS